MWAESQRFMLLLNNSLVFDAYWNTTSVLSKIWFWYSKGLISLYVTIFIYSQFLNMLNFSLLSWDLKNCYLNLLNLNFEFCIFIKLHVWIFYFVQLPVYIGRQSDLMSNNLNNLCYECSVCISIDSVIGTGVR